MFQAAVRHGPQDTTRSRSCHRTKKVRARRSSFTRKDQSLNIMTEGSSAPPSVFQSSLRFRAFLNYAEFRSSRRGMHPTEEYIASDGRTTQPYASYSRNRRVRVACSRSLENHDLRRDDSKPAQRGIQTGHNLTWKPSKNGFIQL